MKHGRSTSTPTKEQQARFDAMKEIGCSLANRLNIGWVYGEIHHLTIGGKHGAKRRGHEFTICLNPWSHRGEPFGGLDADRCMEMFGPSYAKQPRAFRQLIGNDDELLIYQNQILRENGYE